MRKMNAKYLYTTIAHKQKRIRKIPTFFKDRNLLYHLMHSNSLALGLDERGISKHTFQHTTGFCCFREKERRRLSRGDNFFATGKNVWSLSSMLRESSSSQNRKAGHTHTDDDYYTLTANAYVRVMRITWLSHNFSTQIIQKTKWLWANHTHSLNKYSDKKIRRWKVRVLVNFMVFSNWTSSSGSIINIRWSKCVRASEIPA